MKVLFVCMGNICRSPTAEAVLRKLATENGLAKDLQIDSAGTLGFHAGEPPDTRAVAHAAQRGYDLTALRARKVVSADFEHFDYVVAMDDQNVRELQAFCPPHLRKRISLLLDWAGQGARREVPDPYNGTAQDFELVLDLVERGCRGLVKQLLAERRSRAFRSVGFKEQ